MRRRARRRSGAPPRANGAGPLGGEQSPLGVEYFEIGRDAIVVAQLRGLGEAALDAHGLLLRRDLLGKPLAADQPVGHFAEGVLHGALIERAQLDEVGDRDPPHGLDQDLGGRGRLLLTGAPAARRQQHREQERALRGDAGLDRPELPITARLLNQKGVRQALSRDDACASAWT